MKLSLAFVFLMAITLSQASVSMHNPFYCFATDPVRPQSSMFATKVAYEAVRGDGFINPSISTCTPRKFFMYSRHGTRLPGSSDTRRMVELQNSLKANVIANYEAGLTQLCRQDYENIVNWTLNENVTVDRNSELVQTGWDELRGLAERFQAAFPTILPAGYNQSLFLFRATDRQRTIASLQAFAEGLFGEGGWENVQFTPHTEPDFLLRPHDDCPLYDEARDNYVEMDGFKNGPEYDEMLQQVNRKLGFLGSRQLNAEDVHTVWDYCKFELSWEPSTPSPWCAALSIANHAVFDYTEDVYYYANMGYGGDVPLFRNMNCHIMQELLQYLESNDPSDQVARLYSSHSRALQLFLVTLGVFDGDAPLTRHNFAQQTNRQWRSGIIAPMASNFIVIRFDCADGDNDLLVLYNERPLVIPGCESNGLCKQSVFVDRYRRFLDANCAESYCSHDI